MQRQKDSARKLSPEKRRSVPNQQHGESSKKAKAGGIESKDDKVEYRILNFVSVFAAISNLVKCKKCSGDVKFETGHTLGIGFTITLACDNCNPQYIPSSQWARDSPNSYEINRLFVCAMKVLGLEFEGIKTFCSMLSIPQAFYRSLYDNIIGYMEDCMGKMNEALFDNTEESKVAENSGSQMKKPTVFKKAPTKRAITSVIDVCMFKDGFKAFVKVLQSLGGSSGLNVHRNSIDQDDAER